MKQNSQRLSAMVASAVLAFACVTGGCANPNIEEEAVAAEGEADLVFLLLFAVSGGAATASATTIAAAALADLAVVTVALSMGKNLKVGVRYDADLPSSISAPSSIKGYGKLTAGDKEKIVQAANQADDTSRSAANDEDATSPAEHAKNCGRWTTIAQNAECTRMLSGSCKLDAVDVLACIGMQKSLATYCGWGSCNQYLDAAAAWLEKCGVVDANITRIVKKGC